MTTLIYQYSVCTLIQLYGCSRVRLGLAKSVIKPGQNSMGLVEFVQFFFANPTRYNK